MKKEKLSDEELFRLCRKYGKNTRYWRQKFAGLLPEVLKRGLYEKKGFSSIFEFAAKLAGMSHEHVRTVLNLERKLEYTPVLQTLLTSGEVSANKLIRIASIATPQNQEALAQQVQILSNRAIETLVRDVKTTSIASTQSTESDGLQKPLFEAKSLHVHSKTTDIGSFVKIMEKLSMQVQQQLLDLIDKNIDINKIIETTLKDRETKIAQEKAEIAPEQTGSRYIPAKIKKIIAAEQGAKCAVPSCNRPSQVTHHQIPFALSQNHAPQNLQKLCLEHHEIAHTINIKFCEIRRRTLDTS